MLIAEREYRALRAALEVAAPAESGAFLLLGWAKGSFGVRLYLRDLLLPRPDAWRLQGPAQLAPTTLWTSVALDAAERAGTGLAFIHTHPGPGIGARFSAADEWWHDGVVPAMLDNLDGRPFASFVMSEGVINGALWIGGERHRCPRVTVLGSRASEVGLPAAGRAAVDGTDRQLLVWAAAGQSALTNARIAVVGAGGTGSAVAEQLVRLGVRSLVLVDFDILTASNVSRVYGSTLADVGRPKVEVLADYLRRINGADVLALTARVDDGDAVQQLLGCDLVMGCTDSHQSRSVLNDLAVQHFVPVVDVGCRVACRAGVAEGLLAEVRVLRPDLPCLWCIGAISADMITVEALPDVERLALAERGYVRGLGAEPSVIPLTTGGATAAVLRALDLLVGIAGFDPNPAVHDLLLEDYTRIHSAVSPSCACRHRKGIGDRRPVGRAHRDQ